MARALLSPEEEGRLLERFLRYVRTYSESSSAAAEQGTVPSTPQQWGMARLLQDELSALALEDVQVTEHCYVYARLAATPGFEKAPCFCLLSHLDTVDEVTGLNVSPQVHERYDGAALDLGQGGVLDPAVDGALREAARARDTIITTDGTTLLGADDKAGIAEIMTALDYLAAHPEVPHGTVEVMFSPDEETGHGMDFLPRALLRSTFAYTVDGGHEGELETECFNAWRADAVFTGKSKHTGSARPDMVNAVCMAAAFVAGLPRHQMPETTDGYQGFYAPMGISGTMEKAGVSLLLRDFTEDGMEARKRLVEQVARTVALTFGGSADVAFARQYLNMRQVLDRHPRVVRNLMAAYEAAGVKPVLKPIRGGTDGSRLSELGIPTPNIFTGAHNLHSRQEWASLAQMASAANVLIHLARLWAEEESACTSTT